MVCCWHLYSMLGPFNVQLFYLDAAAEILEWPLAMLRKATIPLLERECYSRPWFLAALVSPQQHPVGLYMPSAFVSSHAYGHDQYAELCVSLCVHE